MPSMAANIPLVDLSGLQDDVAEQLVSAAIEHGFIYIRNLGHDIPASDVDEAFALSRKLFAAPVVEKQACSMQTNNRGWSAIHGENLDPKNHKIGDFKEVFNFGEFVNGKAQQPIPATIANDEASYAAFAGLCRALCLKILTLLGQGLQVGDFLKSAHFQAETGSGSTLRFLRYPPPSTTSHAKDDVRAGAHSDYGSITLLFRLQGQAGLQVLSKDNSWVSVPVVPPGTENDPSPPILINIGDLLSYWTNGLFKSTMHRVVFPDDEEGGDVLVPGETSIEARYSIVYFCQPMDYALLEPIPSQLIRDFAPAEDSQDANPYAKRKVMTAGEHLLMRLKATYGTLYTDEETSP